MSRLVLVVLAVCVLWWSWLVFAGAPAAAADPGAEAGARKGPLRILAATGPHEPGAGLPRPVVLQAAGKDDANGRAANSSGSGAANGNANGSANGNGNGKEPKTGNKDPQGTETGGNAKERPARSDFRVLTAATGNRRAEIARALLQRAEAAPDVGALLRLLGQGNAFLHSTEGRKVARRTLVQIHREPPERAVVHSTALLNQCMRGAIRQEDLEARQLVDEIYQRHKPLVRRVVFDPERLEGARRHRVQAGETLGQIATRVRREGILVEPHTLALVNRISNPNMVRAGQLLKIPVRAFKAVLEKRSFLMAMYLGDVMIRLYWVGHGADDLTPETTFTVGTKLEHPEWFAPDGNRYAYGDPRNVLGDYFVKFDHASYTGFGAHGTPDPGSIGKMASQGCIRMRDRDIREFFQIMPQGCHVEIRATE